MVSLEGDEVMRGTLTGEISLLTKETPESSHPLPPPEDMLKIRLSMIQEAGPCKAPDLLATSSALLTVGKEKFCGLKATQSMVFLL